LTWEWKGARLRFSLRISQFAAIIDWANARKSLKNGPQISVTQSRRKRKKSARIPKANRVSPKSVLHRRINQGTPEMTAVITSQIQDTSGCRKSGSIYFFNATFHILMVGLKIATERDKNGSSMQQTRP
jgi:hypothetical protein